MSTIRLPLGTFVGARSGDKGGNANVGVWIVDPIESAAVDLSNGREVSLVPSTDADRLADSRFAWLVDFLSVERIRLLLPEAENLEIDVFALPNLRAINVVIHGLLGRGVAETTRSDPQAKGLGEQLRARLVDLPTELVGAR